MAVKSKELTQWEIAQAVIALITVLLVILALSLPGFSPLACSTGIFSKIGNAFMVMALGFFAIASFQPFAVQDAKTGPEAAQPEGPKLLGGDISWWMKLLRMLWPFYHSRLANAILIAALVAVGAGMHLTGYSIQRGRDVLPVVKQVNYTLASKPTPRPYHSGDRVDLRAGESASFTVEMLSSPPVHCLWKANYGLLSPGEECDAAYVASSSSDVLMLTVQSSCKSSSVSQGILIDVR